jgi:hypothetical protein
VFQEILGSNSKLPEGFTQEHFNTMRDKFARVPETNIWEDLQKFEFAPLAFHHILSSDKDITVEEDKVPLHPRNAFFLPSRLDEEPFLFSEESTSSFVTVYLFLRTFCYWLQMPHDKIQYVVLDCHGAHDMFTVGSLLAAQELITVTTLDAGSIHGTAELIKSINSIRDQFSPKSEAVLVINNLRDWDDPDAENAFGGKITGFEKVEIAEDHEIRDIMKEYEFGDVSHHKRLWKSIGDICGIILGRNGTSHSPQTHAPNSDLPNAEATASADTFPTENEQPDEPDG